MTPVYSPPTENPITQRRPISSQAAAGPTCAWVGSMAVASIAADMTIIDSSSIGRRPRRSPTCPNTTAPTGRIT